MTLQELFKNRPDFVRVYEPLVGNSMLELGNKREGEIVYKHVFEGLGFRHVSVDTNGEDGALVLDLRKPLGLGEFDMVTNIGTSEHVNESQEVVWQNIVESAKVGGVIVCLTPAAEESNWQNHGHWYPKHDFYKALADANGLEIELLFDSDKRPLKNTLCRMRKKEKLPFVMPGLDLFLYREKAKKYGSRL